MWPRGPAIMRRGSRVRVCQNTRAAGVTRQVWAHMRVKVRNEIWKGSGSKFGRMQRINFRIYWINRIDWPTVCIQASYCKLVGFTPSKGDRWCHDRVLAHYARACVTGGGEGGLSEAGMQWYITMRSWELWTVCTVGCNNDKEINLQPVWIFRWLGWWGCSCRYVLARMRKMNSQLSACELDCWYQTIQPIVLLQLQSLIISIMPFRPSLHPQALAKP